MKIISYTDDSDSFCKQLKVLEGRGYPSVTQFTLESRYRMAELGKNFQDLSFFMIENNAPVALIYAHKLADFAGYNGSGIEINTLKELGKKQTLKIIEHAMQTARYAGCSELKVKDIECSTHLSNLGQELFNQKGQPSVRLAAIQDLKLNEDDLHKQLRQSYKSLVNQGNKEIKFTYVTKSSPDEEMFRNFQAFHKKVAGRQTRPEESWNIQYEMIKAGTAELIMGEMPEYGLVSSALFTDFGDMTTYAVAVYNRELFDKPLAHASVYNGMLRAKSRGQRIFNLGTIPSYSDKIEKEYNIGKFKKGFCRALSSNLEWSIALQSQDQRE